MEALKWLNIPILRWRDRGYDYHWTELLVREAGYFMDVLAMQVKDHSIVIENLDQNRIYLINPKTGDTGASRVSIFPAGC